MKHVAKQFRAISLPNPYNVGTIDRAIRFVIGGVLIGSVFFVNPASILTFQGLDIALYKLLPLIGIYPALTAWLGWDPVYNIFNIRSCTGLKSDVCDDIVEQTKAVTNN
jgi:hypothetical protein